MKKLIIIAITMLLLTGCAQKDSKEQETLNSVAQPTNQKMDIPKGWEVVDNPAEYVSVSESQDYNFETDQQFNIPNNYNTAETKDAYYIIDSSHQLYVWDKETKTSHILCDKPECRHQLGTQVCNATLTGAQGLYYWEGNLYTVIRESIMSEGEIRNEQIVLQKISLDGTERTDMCVLAEGYVDETEEYEDNTFTVYGAAHRGYLYYTYNFGTGTGMLDTAYYNNNSHILYRVKLDGSEEPECIQPLAICGDIANINIMGDGSYVYYVDTEWGGQGELYRINTESEKIEKVNIGKIMCADYVPLGESIIYKKTADDTVFYKYNVNTGEETTFVDFGEKTEWECWNMRSDGTYYYVTFVLNGNIFDAKEVVLDSQGSYLAEFYLEDLSADDDFILAYGGRQDDYLMRIGEEGCNCCYVDKNQFAQGIAQIKGVSE